MALVTGGTRRTGAAICRELADQRAHVAAGFWHDHEAAGKFLASTAADYPDQRITVHEGNIGQADDCRRVLREATDQHGQVARRDGREAAAVFADRGPDGGQH